MLLANRFCIMIISWKKGVALLVGTRFLPTVHVASVVADHHTRQHVDRSPLPIRSSTCNRSGPVSKRAVRPIARHPGFFSRKITSHLEVLGLQYLATQGMCLAMSTNRKDSDYLNGVPELLLLRLLTRQPMYGYELVQGIRLFTNGVLAFGEGCIYPVLHRLEAEGLIHGTREEVGGRARVVYRLVPAGRKRFAAAMGRWEQVAAAISAALKGDGHAATALG